jgi:hypothetical protein
MATPLVPDTMPVIVPGCFLLNNVNMMDLAQ